MVKKKMITSDERTGSRLAPRQNTASAASCIAAPAHTLKKYHSPAPPYTLQDPSPPHLARGCRPSAHLHPPRWIAQRGSWHPPAPESFSQPCPSCPSLPPASAGPPPLSPRAFSSASIAAAAAAARRSSSRAARAGSAAPAACWARPRGHRAPSPPAPGAASGHRGGGERGGRAPGRSGRQPSVGRGSGGC